MTRADRITVAASLGLAALLRLVWLGAAPLGPDEAAHAWRALRLAGAGDPAVAGITSPFTAAAQAVVFAFLGAGDALARVPAAACGIALAGVPVLAWPVLGRARSLALCALLAFEPALVGWSRRATGESAAALAAALLAVALLRWEAGSRRRAGEGRTWAVVTAAAVGFLLTTGPAAWALLPPLALVAARLRPWSAAAVQPGRLLAASALAALACSTAGLLAIPWASAVSVSLTTALAGAPAGPAALLSVAAAPSAALVLAAAGLAAVPRPRALPHAAAIAWGVLVAVASSSGLALTLACVACAADGLGVLAEARGGSRGRGALAALPVLGLVLFARLTRVPAPGPEDRALRLLAADVRETAVERGHAANEMPLVIVGDPPDAEVAWALRDVRPLAWAAVRPPSRGTAPLLVAPADAAGVPDDYARRVYGAGSRAVALWVPRGR
jgi:hypothetical protein